MDTLEVARHRANKRTALFVLFAFVAVLAFYVFGGAAYAAEAVPNVGAQQDKLDPWLVTIIGGTLIPLLTGLITKVTADGGTKVLVNALLAAALAVANTLVNTDGVYVLRDLLTLFFTTLIVSIAMYFGVWKPTVGPNLSKVSPKIAAAGIGSGAPPEA